MPVESHPIHPMTQFPADYRPGCYNAPRPKKDSDGYWVQERRYNADGTYVYADKFIPYRFTEECHHDGIYSNCEGCEHRRVK